MRIVAGQFRFMHQRHVGPAELGHGLKDFRPGEARASALLLAADGGLRGSVACDTIRRMIAPRTLFVLRILCVPVTALFTGAAPPVLAQVTTADVVDRPSLRAFVERAHAHAEAQLSGATEQEAYEFFDREFRPEGEWRQGPIYFAVVLAEGADRGTIFFHAVQPDLERQNLWNLEDKNGLLIVQELIANAGKNFVEYYFDNPDVIGDEDEGSLKVSWGEELTIMGRKFIILSGFYPATAAP